MCVDFKSLKTKSKKLQVWSKYSVETTSKWGYSVPEIFTALLNGVKISLLKIIVQLLKLLLVAVLLYYSLKFAIFFSILHSNVSKNDLKIHSRV